MYEAFSSHNPSPEQSAHPTQECKGGGRLLRHTFLIAFLLVSGGLLTSGAVELFFRYRESVEAIGALQHEMAQGAAFKIQQFVQDIEKTLRATTQTPEIVTGGLTEAYRFQLIKLLRVAPAVTTAIALDGDGREQIKVSRVQMVRTEELGAYAADDAFVRARKGASYFGPVYFVRQSEPYMRLAIPIERFAGEVIGVLVAEVNLKYIWEVIAQITVGRTGYAYVVSQEGDLIAHPDISLVLQKRSVRDLGQVQAALAGAPGPFVAQPNLTGQKVFPAYAPIPDLGWAVLVERSAAEAYIPLYASLRRTVVLLLVGLGMALLASLLIGRRVVRPVQILRQGATRIGAGALSQRIDIRTGDELQALAEEFNLMAARLQDSYATLERRVEERTHELREALEQQTATSDILRIIASSPTDLQPMLDAVAENAARLCDANDAQILRIEREILRPVASYGSLPALMSGGGEEIPINRGSVTGRAVVDRHTIHVHDLAAAPETEFPGGKTSHQRFGHRTTLATPLLREGVAMGAMLIRRLEVRPFADKQIQLLETFADQAVIAIENIRLFQELQARTRELGRSVAELQALGEVSQAVSSSLELETVLTTIVTHAVQLSGAKGGVIYEYDEDMQMFHLRATHGVPEEIIEVIKGARIRRGEGAMGKAAVTRTPVQVPDMLDERGSVLSRVRPTLAQAGYRSLLAVPLLLEQQTIGGLVVYRPESGEFAPAVVHLLQAFATQSVLAIQNARLFREIEERGRQLEIASKHKSQFLANMSHELRTPLNAILGYTELIVDEIYGPVPEKISEVLDRVQQSGRHLLGLINTVLDLAKIEAGQMVLALADYSMHEVVQTVCTSVESLLTEKRLTLHVSVPPDLPPGKGDAQRLSQVLLNLVGNAIKFTEAGEIGIQVTAADGMFTMAVSDTGVGISATDQQKIFEEFQQADSSSTRKQGGTGLGLAIAKKIIELHGGRIGVESRLGTGSTFWCTLSVRVERPKEVV